MLAFSATISFAQAQTGPEYIRTISGRLAVAGKTSTVTTTDATATHIDSAVIADNTAGIITVQAVGYATNGDGITGKQIVRYSKKAGVLTLGTPANELAIVADTGLSGGTFSMAATPSNNFQVKVTGKAATTVKWRCVVTQSPR